MKNNLFLSICCVLGLSLMLSCSDVETQYEDQAKEISFSPLVQTSGLVTKGPLQGAGSLPSTFDFLVSAYIAQSSGTQKTTSNNYFTDIPFVYSTNHYWTGEQYWPLYHCELNFSAVTRRCGINNNVTVEWDKTTPASAAKVTLTNNNVFNQSDVMFGGTRGSYAPSHRHILPLNFKHALCWVNFKFKSTMDSKITIKSVKMKAIYNGELDVRFDCTNSADFDPETYSSAEWTPGELQEVQVPNSSYNDVASFITLSSKAEHIFGGGLLALPSSNPERLFTIVYTMKMRDENGGAVEKEFVFEQLARVEWEMGVKYTYIFEFSPTEITMESNYEDWSEQSVDHPLIY